MKKCNLLFRLVVLIGIMGIASLSYGQEAQSKDFSNIKFKNFGQMDERFCRGGQPKDSEYKDLAALGVNTVIDLRDDAQSSEKRNVEALGMRYVNIPMSDTTYPKSEQIAAFLKLTDNPDTGKVFVHCAGGRHRTGVAARSTASTTITGITIKSTPR